MSLFDPAKVPGAVKTDNVRQFNKADAFLNVSLPRTDGSRAKVDSLKLYRSKPMHAEILDYVDMRMSAGATQDEAVNELFSHALIELKMADGSSSAGLALPATLVAEATVTSAATA